MGIEKEDLIATQQFNLHVDMIRQSVSEDQRCRYPKWVFSNNTDHDEKETMETGTKINSMQSEEKLTTNHDENENNISENYEHSQICDKVNRVNMIEGEEKIQRKLNVQGKGQINLVKKLPR